EGAVERDLRQRLFEEGVEMPLQRREVGGVLRPRKLRRPIERHPALDELLVERPLLAERQVDLERLVEEIGSVLVLRDLSFETDQHARQQQAPERAVVDGDSLRSQLVALVETELEGERH